MPLLARLHEPRQHQTKRLLVQLHEPQPHQTSHLLAQRLKLRLPQPKHLLVQLHEPQPRQTSHLLAPHLKPHLARPPALKLKRSSVCLFSYRGSAVLAQIRLANESDALKMLSIYAPVVRDTPSSFEVEPPSEAEFRSRIRATTERVPWLVCEISGELLGYAYAGSHRTRAAYQWSVESSVYVGAGYRRKGVAKALYASLFKVLQLQGFYNAYAGISLPNPASVALHEAVGFEPVGIYRLVGYKLGKWHDVGWWQLSLQQERSGTVHPPLPLSQVWNSAQWHQALRSGLNLLRV